MNLGHSLYTARKNCGLTQEETAAQLGVSRQTISKWETDETLPDMRQAKCLANLYPLSLDELIAYDADVTEIRQVIQKTSQETQEKIDWTKLWGEKYPVLTTYQQEVDIKTYAARLQELLGGFAPVKAVQGMAEPLHYRNKAIASFATQRGKLVCGLYAEGTHRVLPGADCLLQEEILNKTLAAVLDAARACRWTAYDEDRGTGLLRHTVLRSSGGGKVLVTLVTPGPDLPGSKNFCTALRKKAPWVVSIVQNINPTRSSAVLGSREKTLYGPGFVLDTLCGTQFAISSRSFYQVNRTQTEVLYKKALELAKLTGRETVIDAYCGIGTIGLCAAPRAKQVIGVERNPAAVKDAAANARRNKIANARFVCADATEWMAAAAGEGLHPDVVFLDPPRAGSTPECIAAVNKMKPRRIVYVSCDPETLARDVAAFTRLGWRAAKFCPVDLFPQTKHVETVVLLSKGEVDSKKIRVEFSLEDMDMSEFQDGATYTQIKDYVLEHSGLKVSNLYISQIKRKCGIEVGKNYNLPKSEDSRQPMCPPEKEKAIREAFKYFGMI